MKAAKGQIFLFPFIAISLVPTMVPENMVDNQYLLNQWMNLYDKSQV